MPAMLGGAGAGTGDVLPTFLPYPDFVASAAVLDDRRLGKQRPIAKPPTTQDTAAMAEEAAAEPEFRFLPATAVTPETMAGIGLVVLDGVDRAALPELRVPVLTLRPEPAVSRTA